MGLQSRDQKRLVCVHNFLYVRAHIKQKNQFTVCVTSSPYLEKSMQLF